MKSILLILGLMIFGSAYAQNNFDDRLLAKFSQERIEELSKDYPSVIAYWTYYLDHSYIIVDGDATGKLLASNQSVKIKNLDDFNILDLDVHMNRDMRVTYDIAGTNSYLVMLSNSEFSKAFNNQRK